MIRSIVSPSSTVLENTETQSIVVKCVIKDVHVVPMGLANAFLIEGDDGLALIDAGFPGREAAVFVAIRGLGAGHVALLWRPERMLFG
jgi:hypothetical protein